MARRQRRFRHRKSKHKRSKRLKRMRLERSRRQSKQTRKVRRLARRKRIQTKPYRRRSRRRMVTFSNGQRQVVVLSRKMAGINGQYLNAVRRLLHTNDPTALKEFQGRSLKDTRGREFILEVRANTLYRLNSVPEPIAEIYQVIA